MMFSIHLKMFLFVFYRHQAFRKHPDSVYTAKHVIHMRLKKRTTICHDSKVDSLHYRETCDDKEKTVIVQIVPCFFLTLKSVYSAFIL